MGFKKIRFVLLLGIPAWVFGSSHSVPVLSYGNRLDFTVFNSGSVEMGKICVTVYSKPDWISFSSSREEIDILPAKEKRVVSFFFDVITSEAGLNGEIELQIMDLHGQMIGRKCLELVTQLTEDQSNLALNYPNPGNPSMTIPFVLTKEAEVSLVIYNMLGQEVRILFQGKKMPGHWEVYWDGKDKWGIPAPSGTYLVRLKVVDAFRTQMFTRKVIIQK